MVRLAASTASRAAATASKAAKAATGNAATAAGVESATGPSASAAGATGNVQPGKHYDIAIVGSGAAGLALACGVGSSKFLRSLRVALVGENEVSCAAPGVPGVYSNRVVALSRSSVDFLTHSAEAWRRIPPDRVAQISRMNIWQGNSSNSVTFDAKFDVASSDASDSEQLAYVVETPQLSAALSASLEDIKASGSIQLTRYRRLVDLDHQCADRSAPSRALSCESHSSQGTAPAQNITASLVVGADGGKSTLRSLAKIRNVMEISYGASALVATLSHEFPVSGTAYQRFLSSGPIALLPLPGETVSSLVWSLPSAAVAKTMAALDEGDFLACVNAALSFPDAEVEALMARLAAGFADASEPDESVASYVGWRRAHALSDDSLSDSYPPHVTSAQADSRAHFPLRLAHASTYVADRVALIGDAAHTVHPLAGQGLNLGIADAASLLRRLEGAARLGEDLGSLQVLRKYESDRYLRNYCALAFCDAVNAVSRSRLAALKFAWPLGLRAFNSFAAAKRAAVSLVSRA